MCKKLKIKIVLNQSKNFNKLKKHPFRKYIIRVYQKELEKNRKIIEHLISYTYATIVLFLNNIEN